MSPENFLYSIVTTPYGKRAIRVQGIKSAEFYTDELPALDLSRVTERIGEGTGRRYHISLSVVPETSEEGTQVGFADPLTGESVGKISVLQLADRSIPYRLQVDSETVEALLVSSEGVGSRGVAELEIDQPVFESTKGNIIISLDYPGQKLSIVKEIRTPRYLEQLSYFLHGEGGIRIAYEHVEWTDNGLVIGPVLIPREKLVNMKLLEIPALFEEWDGVEYKQFRARGIIFWKHPGAK